VVTSGKATHERHCGEPLLLDLSSNCEWASREACFFNQMPSVRLRPVLGAALSMFVASEGCMWLCFPKALVESDGTRPGDRRGAEAQRTVSDGPPGARSVTEGYLSLDGPTVEPR